MPINMQATISFAEGYQAIDKYKLDTCTHISSYLLMLNTLLENLLF